MMGGSRDYDVVIIGAGIAGICAAYRLQERCPHLTYCVLEGRHEIGGTWSLFKYPGIRSDSDLYTYSFPWRPWKGKAIAQGAEILKYLKDAADEHGITKKIKLNCRVDGMSWSGDSQTWTLDITAKAVKRHSRLKSRFIMLATGYYSYDVPLQAKIPGIDNFKNPVVHPQFWPQELDYKNKNIVVIGSGATAITLVPTLSEKAARVTMLQRSPTYIASVPSESLVQILTKALFPLEIASRIIRLQWILFMLVFVQFCRYFPGLSWALLLLRTRAELPLDESVTPNFSPHYQPFDQNLCLTPDSEFYEALRKSRIGIKTCNIDKVTSTGIKPQIGAELKADIIITATGLRLCFGGDIKITVNGEPFVIADHFVWKGCMLDGLPNTLSVLGYFDASWTLGTDISAKRACRLLNHATRHNKRVMVPHSPPGMKRVPFTYLNATYVTTANDIIPDAGDRPQWKPRGTYLSETADVWWGDITTDMEWS